MHHQHPRILRHVRIMVVDDHALILELVTEFLSSNGYEVVATASDGSEALEKMEPAQPDVVITDLNMPGMDGFELIRCLAQHFPGVRIIAFSSDAHPVLTDKCLNLGAHAFVDKADLVAQLPSELERLFPTLVSHGAHSKAA